MSQAWCLVIRVVELGWITVFNVVLMYSQLTIIRNGQISIVTMDQIEGD